MSRSRTYTRGTGVSAVLPAVYIILTAIGAMTVYSSMVDQSMKESTMVFPPGYSTYLTQIAIGVVLFFLVGVIQQKFWHIIHVPAYVGGLLLLLAVAFLGHEVHGARSWFRLPGGMSLQVAELVKLSTALSLAALLSHYRTDLSTLRYQAISLAVIVAPIILVLLQPDAGTAGVFLGLTLVLFLAGFPAGVYLISTSTVSLFIISEVINLPMAIAVLLGVLSILYTPWDRRRIMRNVPYALVFLAVVLTGIFMSLTGSIIVLAAYLVYHAARDVIKKKFAKPIRYVSVGAIVLLITVALNYVVNHVLQPHQRDRIDVWLSPGQSNPQGSLYNIIQSKMAISSGGIAGKGFLQGYMTRLDYVPEQSTDFIFTVIGEEQGFLGAASVIVLFGILIFYLLRMAQQQRQQFNKYFILCVTSYFIVHVIINIGMTLGIMPVVGIPLPLISRGGSAFIAFSVMLGIIQSYNYHRDA